MKLIQQRNRWSCLLTSFAITLETTEEELIKEIGHDGSDFIWPDEPEPRRRRAFHIQEFLIPCENRDYALVTIEPAPVCCPHPGKGIREIEERINSAVATQYIALSDLKRLLDKVRNLQSNNYQVPFSEARFRMYLGGYNGVLIGETLAGNAHAIAWNAKEQKCYDPSGGLITSIEDFIVESFYALYPMEKINDG